MLWFSRSVVAVLCAAVAAGAGPAAPNFLIVIADDCTVRDLGVYGGQAQTPCLDRLAAEGMRFTKCFQAAPMCSPTRHCLYTGLYPVKSGAYPNHTMAYDWVKSVAHYLKAAGYAAHLSGKRHIGPPSVFPFDYSRRAGDGNPDPAAFEAVLRRARESGSPFLFIAASHEPHGPWTKGDPAAYPPASLRLPPIWADTPETRDGFSKYLAEVTYFDGQVGEFVGRLDRHGFRDSTLVIVLSEQGNSLPFAKWTCYDAGLRSACIARWPGRIRPGSVSDAMIEYVDVVPTLLDAAGLPRPEVLDGRSFLPVLRGDAVAHKTHVFGLQTSRGINGGPECFGIRSARDERYLYIRNLTPEVEFRNAATKDPIFESWLLKAAAGDGEARRLTEAYRRRPAEELYDGVGDPWNLTNRVGDAALAGLLDDLRAKMDAWMRQQGDEGQATEMKALERMPRQQKAAGGSDDETPRRPRPRQRRRQP